MSRGGGPRANPYRVLGIDQGASPREITLAYRRRVREVHPDAPGGDAELLAAVVEAYRLLRDQQRRAEDGRDRAPARGTAVPVRVRQDAPATGRTPDLVAGPVRYHPTPRRPR
ncbi:J domain-containing protein [Amycolatopsis sp. YIM 10]|uniref:J domain-containing protein n=1 Tax=Amycolatopsis sp. YIM 10 TaxID=2653857 RepID=UPI001290885E|nr:J domain-containing protein [Amycolatopsis sp. YIM 10]QFU91133.1 Chaperone protein DnaJ [Amycolatopsis sp. YIM 10]